MSPPLDTKPTQSGRADCEQSVQRKVGIVWQHPVFRIDLLPRKRVTIGRGDDCDIVLPGERVSRKHAIIEWHHAGFVVRDCQSKNGTRVNGIVVEVAPLSEQDVIRLGDWVGVLASLSSKQIDGGEPCPQLGEGLYGGNEIEQAFDLIRRAANSELSIMLVGETGTGKEVFARQIHVLSKRTGKQVAVNCAALPENMAEAELFGYRRGAFTGAERAHVGHFRQAHQGTLFLDEIPDLNLAVQAKMLRVLEEKEVVPLGQSATEPANARLICASQLPLHEYVERGTFRVDLYGRLNGMEVPIPALRHRREEIVSHLLRQLVQGEQSPRGEPVGEPVARQERAGLFSPDLVEQLCVYDWPLNVREVVQLARRLRALFGNILLAGSPNMGVTPFALHHLPERIATYSRGNSSQPALSAEPPPRGSETDADNRGLEPRNALAEQLAAAVRAAKGNVSVAAKKLGITRPMAYRLLKRVPDIDPEALRLKAFLDS